jgi:hypothetical protein
MKDSLITAFGWYGAAAVLFSYALVSFGAIHPSGPAYIFLNLTGSIGLAIQAYRKQDTPLMALNSVWIGIALVGLIKLLR